MWKIITNIGWIFFDKIFRLLMGMLVSVWITRYLGPSEFGLLNYAMLFPTIFTAFAGFGLTNILLVDFVSANGDLEKQHRLVQTGFFIKLVVGTLAYIISCSLNNIFNKDNSVLFQLINFTGITLILQSSDVIDTYFQSQTKAKVSITVKLIGFGLASLLRVYALLTHQGILFLVIINIIELLIVFILAIIVYQQKVNLLFTHIRQVITYEPIQQLIRVAWPLMITEFFIFVYMKVDQFMIESLSTNRELGLYGAALRLSETWYFIAGAITTSVYPKIAESWPINKERFYNQYQDLLNVLTYVSLALAIFVSLFSNQLIKLLYGPEYQQAGIILSVHIWAGIFVFTGVGINNLMIIKNLQKFILFKTTLCAVLNILLNLWLIPDYGALGASVATLISYGFQAYGLNLFSKEARFVFNLQSRSFINFITLQRPLATKFN